MADTWSVPGYEVADSAKAGGGLVGGSPSDGSPPPMSSPDDILADMEKAEAEEVAEEGQETASPTECTGNCKEEGALENPEFADEFEKKTGMSLEDSIKLYEAQTGEELSPRTVERLFTDPDFAEQTLSNNRNLHTTYRGILNTNVPGSPAEAAEQGFTQLPWHKSMFHNPQYGLNPFVKNNSKWVSADGHLEAVFNPSGVLVTDNDYLGTFNFFGPDQAGAHWSADVVPYRKWGN